MFTIMLQVAENSVELLKLYAGEYKSWNLMYKSKIDPNIFLGSRGLLLKPLHVFVR